MTLPSDRDARNAIPVWDGVVVYFPDAWAEIAKVSVIGNKQHNLGAEKLYFNRSVSTDHANKVMRHMLDHAAGNVFDTDGTYHLAKAAWRALAALQVAIEAEAGAMKQGAVIASDPAYCACGSYILSLVSIGGLSGNAYDPLSIGGDTHASRGCYRTNGNGVKRLDDKWIGES